MTQIPTLKALVANSSLSRDEQAEFVDVLLVVDKENISILLELFTEDPNWIPWLYDNYKEKVDAFRTQNTSKLAQIIESEKKQLEKE